MLFIIYAVLEACSCRDEVLITINILQTEGTFQYPELFEQNEVDELKEMEQTPAEGIPTEREIPKDIKNWFEVWK